MFKKISAILLVVALVLTMFAPAASAQSHTRTFHNDAYFDGSPVEGVLFIGYNQLGYNIGSCVTGANGYCGFQATVYTGDSYCVRASYSPWYIVMWSNQAPFSPRAGNFYGQLRMSYWGQDTLTLWQSWSR